jgi:hypothetical protein
MLLQRPAGPESLMQTCTNRRTPLLRQVEVYKYGVEGRPPSVGVVRACIAGVPPGYRRLEVREVPLDDIW